jgi:hypothetical protein
MTPTDGMVRGRYCDGVYMQTGHTTEGEDFDRWLAQHDRKVAAAALRGFASASNTSEFHIEVLLGGSDYVRHVLRECADMAEQEEETGV